MVRLWCVPPYPEIFQDVIGGNDLSVLVGRTIEVGRSRVICAEARILTGPPSTSRNRISCECTAPVEEYA